jgi:hypothetical protein
VSSSCEHGQGLAPAPAAAGDPTETSTTPPDANCPEELLDSNELASEYVMLSICTDKEGFPSARE